MGAEGDAKTTRYAVSADGTRIAYAVVGDGPLALFVHGMGADHNQFAPLVPLLAESFTLYLMDRRGCGMSSEEGDGSYSWEREAEDIGAVVEAVEQPPRVWGHGYGGVCVLEAAQRGVAFEHVLVDDIEGGAAEPLVPRDLIEEMSAALGADDRDAALALFLKRLVGLTDEQIEEQRDTDRWKTRTKSIHTFVREARAANAVRYDPDRLASIGCPVRFVVGTESTQAMLDGARRAHDGTPGSKLDVIEGRLFTTMYDEPAAAARAVGDWLLRP